jgi:ParB family chromosome partitioning protein
MGGPLAVAKDGAIASMREELDAARADMGARLSDSTLLLRLDPSQIIDEVGSDRIQEHGQDDQFAALRDDILQRGQTTAIRVRPARPGWQPDAAGRARPGDQFILQSGRRRVAVCLLLKTDVLASVTAVTPGEETLEDLIERFAENTVRADLTGYERYLSIGQIAGLYDGKTNGAIAEILHVARPDVSIGKSVWELRKDLETFTNGDIVGMPQRQVRPLVKLVRDWISDGRPSTQTQKRARPEAIEYRRVGGVTAVTARKSGKKMVLEFDVRAGQPDVTEALELFLKAHFTAEEH